MSSKINLDRIRTVAESYSPQEMFAALVWQKQFNNFDGKQIIADLSDREDLWYSFSFGKGVYAPPDNGGMSFAHVANILLAMANYRPMPTNSYLEFDPYPGDTLYVLTENEETLATQLMDLGKKWQADSVEIIDRHNQEYGFFTQHQLRECLASRDKILYKLNNLQRLDAIVVIYWWD